MIKFYTRQILWGFIFLIIPAVGFAANVSSWQIVPTESTLTFTATQNGSPVTGSFTKFSGDIHFDPNLLDKSTIRIVVDMNSVTTSYALVAQTLKMQDWFDVKDFPQAIFQANKLTKTGDNTYQAAGTLTLRGKTEPIVLNFTTQNLDTPKAQAKGSTTIQRTVFGVGQGDWSTTKEIKDDVQINFQLTGTKQSS